jgi:hypothetical protein
MTHGARYEIAVDGQSHSNRDTKPIALEAGEHLKSKNPSFEVTCAQQCGLPSLGAHSDGFRPNCQHAGHCIGGPRHAV